MLSDAVQQRLFNLAQTPASQAGQLLAARGLSSFDPEGAVQIARNVGVHLQKTWAEAFGGDLVRKIMDRIASNFAEPFTGEEIERIYSENQAFREMFDQAVSRIRPLPSLKQVIEQIFSTPISKQDDLPKRLVEVLVNKFKATPDEAARLAVEFTRTFAKSFKVARERAVERAFNELAPKARKAQKEIKPLWDKIRQSVRAGLFDPGSVLELRAEAAGWTIPTPEQKAQMRAWAVEEERLRTPTERQIANHGGDVTAATREAEKGTESERLDLIRKMQADWSRWSMPVSVKTWLSGHPEVARNNAKAVNEVVASNLLLKVGFAVRQFIDVVPVSMALNAVNRSIVHVLDRSEGLTVESVKDLDAALREMATARIASFKATYRAAERTATGHTSRKILDRMNHSIGVFDRMLVKADEIDATGNTAGARALRLLTVLRAGYRIAEVFDTVQSVGLEWQEMRQQLSTDLRKAGRNRAEIATTLDDLFGGIKVDLLQAMEEARAIGTERGLEKDKATLEADAWRLIKARAYDRMRSVAGTNTDYEAENEELRELHAWNLPETGGVGGVIAETIKTIKTKTEKAGVPTGGLFSFGNAMGIAANRMLTFSGGGLFGGYGFGDSPWYHGEANKRQRRIEGIQGLAAIGLLIALAAAGKILVQIAYPKDKDEKEKFIADGHKINTVRFVGDDGKSWVEIPIQMSPLSFIASPIYMIGGVQQLLTNQHKEQQRLDAQAAKTGATPGKAKPIGTSDVMGVLAQGLYGMLTGGRTASGAVQSFTDYGNFNLNKAVSATVSPYIPGLPAWQEASRMMGAAVDTRTATLLELMAPSPWSGHQRVNSLGDPLVNPNAATRILQVLSGGFGFGSDEGPSDHAYRQLFAAGYATPEINRNQGYDFGGLIRPMTPKELETYTVARGRAFKQELEGINVDGQDEPSARKTVQAAYQRANARALGEVGVTPRARSSEAPAAPARAATVAPEPIPRAPYAGLRRPSIRPASASLRLRRGRAPSSRFGRGPSLRIGRTKIAPAKALKGRSLRLRSPRLRRR